MKIVSLVSLACIAAFPLAAPAADNPFQAFHGKVKAGLYEYRTEMDMGQIPGMPPGMGKQTHTFQHCVTPEDIQRGEMNKNDRNNMPKNCDVKDFRMSGNTASYRMVCTGQHPMTADNRITFNGSGYEMDMTMDMSAGGQPMHMKQHMQARYMGACAK
ncbi:MAG TPA: DUF3617 domain-containing protein [Usitatibacter sp.]|nr:DUF3617 domain-containing protein [Usitatibacter sp.]